jgi:DNA-binding winged helix-turn-helix (wHTH) protein
MARLREKLGKKGAQLIETVPGFGYRVNKEIADGKQKSR